MTCPAGHSLARAPNAPRRPRPDPLSPPPPPPPRRCRKWAASGGKSNAYFAKTRDDRYIVKSLSKAEKASFLDFAPAYFEYLANKMGASATTCLAKVRRRPGPLARHWALRRLLWLRS